MRTGEPSAFPEPERPLRPSRTQRVKRLLLGRPKNLQDPHLFRHISLIAFLAWVVAANLGRAHEVAHEVSAGLSHGMSTLGFGGLALLFLRAYSLGGGTYTGIEAVSNGLQIMREPRVQTGKRTMTYMEIGRAHV